MDAHDDRNRAPDAFDASDAPGASDARDALGAARAAESRAAHRPTRASRFRGLLLLNGALLIGLAAVSWNPSAGAQDNTPRGDYTMVAGGVNSSPGSAAIYIADALNEELVAIIYNQQTKVIEGVGFRNLRADTANIARTGSNR